MSAKQRSSPAPSQTDRVSPDSDPVSAEVQELFRYFEDFTNLERGSYVPRVYRLERTRRLLALFGDPHRELRCIHIAGSKGKGSTATFIAAILRAAGYRTGLYTSPHVLRYEERITLAGELLPPVVYLEAAQDIRRGVEERMRPTMPEAELPSTFELLTLMAFLVFRNIGADFVVLETGLGGRLDATNVVDPVASVITPIELEHTEYLGDTVRKIAREKAAIIKPGRPAFISGQSPEAETSIRERLRGIGDRSVWLSTWLTAFESVSSLRGNRVRIEGDSENRRLRVYTELALLGRVQGENAALAAMVVSTLFPGISGLTIAAGLSRARIAGRGEVITAYEATHPREAPALPTHSRPIILDGAHTPGSVTALVELLREIEAHRCVVIFGSVEGKRHREMMTRLAPVTASMVITRPGTFKRSDLPALEVIARDIGIPAVLEPEAEPALKRALDTAVEIGADAVVATGSFYLLAEIQVTYPQPC